MGVGRLDTAGAEVACPEHVSWRAVRSIGYGPLAVSCRAASQFFLIATIMLG